MGTSRHTSRAAREGERKCDAWKGRKARKMKEAFHFPLIIQHISMKKGRKEERERESEKKKKKKKNQKRDQKMKTRSMLLKNESWAHPSFSLCTNQASSTAHSGLRVRA